MPSIKRVFCEKAISQMQLREFFKKQLEGVGFAQLDVQKTPLGTRVTIEAARPGLVIGKKGSNVKRLTEVLARNFKIENPQIDVEEVKNPELNAQIMAERLANALERGQHYRRAGYGLLRRIIRSGAQGVEIIISGKITSQRARYQKMRQGIIIKCGEPVRDISYGVAHAKLKAGILGIRVKILPPDYYNPKDVEYIGRDGLDPDRREKLREAQREAEREMLFEIEEEEEEELETIEVSPEEVLSDKIEGDIADGEDLLIDDEELEEDAADSGDEDEDEDLDAEEILKEDEQSEDDDDDSVDEEDDEEKSSKDKKKKDKKKRGKKKKSKDKDEESD
ncbi:30S ribosomal protein S3 [Candidatus Bathyarchaeota archaeon]|nr:30S ribosomal protein S3 [Candidatus Bathyarchaeota archaeon]